MSTYVTPKRGAAFRCYVMLRDQSNPKLFKVDPTLASGDVKVSKDGGAFANLSTLPVVTPSGGRAVQVDLDATEMTADQVIVQFVDAAGAEWCDLAVLVQTTARQLDDLAYPATSGRSMAVDAAGLVDATMVKAGPSGSGTAQTARDLGASVLLSPGTGTGQVSLSAGAVTVGTNNDKTGYTASTVSDKTGYALTSAYDAAQTASQAGDAMTLTSGERDAVAAALLDLANAIETGLTMREAFRGFAATLLGKASGMNSTTATFRNAVADSKDRVVATVDAYGNRSAVSTDLT